MTKAMYFEMTKELIANSTLSAEQKEEMLAHADKEIALLANRSSKPTKVQVENEAIKARICDILTNAETPMTVAEIMEATGIASNQKVTSLLTQLRNADVVERAYDKKKAYFTMK